MPGSPTPATAPSPRLDGTPLPQRFGSVAELEDFLSATPLPLTDVIVNPTDGALYFTIGGRNTQSGLYRVTYIGSEPTAPAVRPDTM